MTTRMEIKIGSTLASTSALLSAVEQRFPDASLDKQQENETGIVLTIPDDTVGIWDDADEQWENATDLAHTLIDRAMGADASETCRNPAVAAYAAGILVGLAEAKTNPNSTLFRDAQQAVLFHLHPPTDPEKSIT